MNQSEKRLFLIQSLLKENPAYRDWGVPQGADDQKRLLRGLMNVRPAQNSSAEFTSISISSGSEALSPAPFVRRTASAALA